MGNENYKLYIRFNTQQGIWQYMHVTGTISHAQKLKAEHYKLSMHSVSTSAVRHRQYIVYRDIKIYIVI